MYTKLFTALFAGLCLCLLTACTEAEQISPSSAVQTEKADYESVLNKYGESALNVSITLTVESDVSVEHRFTLTEGEEGYTLTDLDSDRVLTYGADTPTEKVFRTAGYLPPYEIAYPTGEGEYSSRLSGDINLEMLLRGSNLFEGYSAENADLDGECLYTAAVSDGIEWYSYEFAVNVNDGGAQFPAKIKYYIEVNE